MVKLFVGNLPNDCARRDVLEAFEKHGRVTECDIIKNYAFVHLDNRDDAEDAIKALHKTRFLGQEITVEISTSRPRNTCKIYIGNLSSSADREELQKMFEEFGEVAECDIIKDFAFCHMTSRRDAEKAIRELNDEMYCGRRIKVQHANNNDRGGNHFYNGMNIHSRQYRDFYDRWQHNNRGWGGRGRFGGGGFGGGRFGGGRFDRRSPIRRRRSRSRSYSRSRSRSRSRSPRRNRRSRSRSFSKSRSRSRSRSRSVSRSPSRSRSRSRSRT